MLVVVVAECGVSVHQSILLIGVGKQQRQPCLRGTGLHICQAFCIYRPLENSFCGSSRCAISQAHFFKIIFSPGVWTGIPPRWPSDCTRISSLDSWQVWPQNQNPVFALWIKQDVVIWKTHVAQNQSFLSWTWCFWNAAERVPFKIIMMQGIEPDLIFWKQNNNIS